ncbi:hypothetical protein CSQ89_07760 [Chitinimonas sp. BJB300]|nr:hypothetical protein CSQ89_07760 [Chitinimonas sp. BJB300]
MLVVLPHFHNIEPPYFAERGRRFSHGKMAVFSIGAGDAQRDAAGNRVAAWINRQAVVGENT